MTHIIILLSTGLNLYLFYKLYKSKEKVKDLYAKYKSMVTYIELLTSKK
jgi:hypothetical protein